MEILEFEGLPELGKVITVVTDGHTYRISRLDSSATPASENVFVESDNPQLPPGSYCLLEEQVFRHNKVFQLNYYPNGQSMPFTSEKIQSLNIS